MSAIHPDVAALIALGRAAGSLPFEAMSPEEARRAYAERRLLLQLPPDHVAETRDLTIEGPGGPLRLRLYRAAGTGADEILPCLLYLHGGGWVLGDLDSHDGICCRLANEAGCCVVAVHYRLAPEHPFPAALEDAAASLRWLSREAVSLRIDPARIAVGGDSAGGNLAAVLALMGRDGTVPASVFQLLLYPALDMTMESYAGTTEGMTITPATMRYFIDHYVPDPADRTDWRASPLNAATLAGTPPAFVLTCGHDPLRDEGRLYASRLEREGVPVTALHLSDQTHGMLTLSKVIGAFPRTLAYVAAALREGWR
jgi:acetyl esterase